MPVFPSSLAPVAAGPGGVAGAFGKVSVLLAGGGAVGLPIAGHLARAGVRSLVIADPGTFKEESLLTHPIRVADVGSPKAAAAAELAKALSPETHVVSFAGRAEELDESWFAEADVVVLATDRLAPELEVGQRCLHLGRPLFQGSVQGEPLVAQVRTFGGDGACPRCEWGATERAAHARDARFSCDGSEAAPGEPTRSVSALCSLAADLLVLELTTWVLAGRPALADRVLQYCAFSRATTTTALEQRPQCPVDHELRWRRAAASRPVARCTPAELVEVAATAGVGGEGDALALRVAGHVFHAGDESVPFRPEARGAEGPPLDLRREAPLSALRAHLDRPLVALGAAGARAALVSSPAGVVYVGGPEARESVPACAAADGERSSR